MISIGFRDILLIPELSKYNEIQLLPPSMDKLVNKYLKQLAFDITQPIVYIPAKYRDMQNKVAVGFRAVGEINRSREYKGLLDTTQRIVAAGYTDASLAREMAELMGRSRSYTNEDERPRMTKKERELRKNEGYNLYDEDEEDIVQVEEDYEDTLEQIVMLETIRDTVRGPMFNNAGGLKVPSEYGGEKL